MEYLKQQGRVLYVYRHTPAGHIGYNCSEHNPTVQEEALYNICRIVCDNDSDHFIISRL